MRSVDAHLAHLLNSTTPLDAFPIGLLEARGCVVAEDVTAPWPLPAFDTSAVDGYAVSLPDLIAADAEPVTLQVVDVLLPDAEPAVDVTTGNAVRVRAGSAIPVGTDAVVPVDHTDGGLTQVVISRAPKFGQYLRRAGEDVQAGEIVIRAGEQLDHRLIGLLSAIGRNSVVAYPRPRVVVISVGAELLEPGSSHQIGRTVDSAGPMLAAAVIEAGCNAYRVGPVPDDIDVLRNTIEEQLVRADLVILAYSTASRSLETLAALLPEFESGELEQVMMQPGAVQGFALVGDERVPLIAVSAQPVAALVSFEVLVRPVLRKLQGFKSFTRTLVSAVADNSFNTHPNRRNYLRAERKSVEGELRATAVEGRGAHLIARLARTDVLIVIPEAVVSVQAGDPIDLLPLDGTGGWQ